MTDCILERWTKRFLKAAEADDFAAFRKHLERLGALRARPATPRSQQPICSRCTRGSQRWMSARGVSAVCWQSKTYNPRRATGVRYVATFGTSRVRQRAHPRRGCCEIDLADLNGVMWNQYKCGGTTSFGFPAWTAARWAAASWTAWKRPSRTTSVSTIVKMNLPEFLS